MLIASERRPLPAVTLTEVLATSDVPGGVVNVLTGLKKELVPVLAAHEDVDALDTWGVPDEMRTEVETARRRGHQAPVAPADDGRRGAASTGSTTPPPNDPNGSPPSSR